MRERFRAEMDCQIVHDSIHKRPGWSICYELRAGRKAAGFGSVAIGGPWKGRPTVFEFYLLPEQRGRAFEFFEAFLAAARFEYFELQTNDSLFASMLFTHGHDIESERIVFRDWFESKLPARGARLQPSNTDAEVREAMSKGQGGGEWLLILKGETIGKGGILFHYNIPYGDIYMEIAEGFQRRGHGSYLVQELMRLCRGYGAVPAARCSPRNIASRRTLQKAGFVPYAHILNGKIAVQ